MDIKLLQGDCLELMKDIPCGSIDLVLTDPPYSSGGLFIKDRQKNTADKYTDTGYNGASRFPDFSGDNMDQRSFTEFMRMILLRCRKKTKPGGICMVFTDWRQLPAMTDALQMGGWIYREIVVWDKGNSRPTPNRFRNDCEYIIWGTNGKREAKFESGAFIAPGCYHIKGINTRKKHHQTEKPVELMEKLVAIAPENGTVLDCFMGSGTTGVACINTGRNFVGMELGEWYFETARTRIKEAMSKRNDQD